MKIVQALMNDSPDDGGLSLGLLTAVRLEMQAGLGGNRVYIMINKLWLPLQLQPLESESPCVVNTQKDLCKPSKK